jgi:hypothetical protein
MEGYVTVTNFFFILQHCKDYYVISCLCHGNKLPVVLTGNENNQWVTGHTLCYTILYHCAASVQSQ